MNRKIFETQVKVWGMVPTSMTGGQEALEALLAAARGGRPFSLVLLDANMPDLDGFGVAEQIGQHPELANPTIMMLSSSGHDGEAERCRSLGIAAYLTKPIRRSRPARSHRPARSPHTRTERPSSRVRRSPTVPKRHP